MLVIKVECKDEKERLEKMEEFHNALVSSPAYVNSEIAICHSDENSFLLVVGKNNGKDTIYSIKAKALVKPKE